MYSRFEEAQGYDPPIAEDEWLRLKELPVGQYVDALSSRRKPVTRMRWLEDSIRYSFFWKGVARHSVFPIGGVLLVCLLVGILQIRDAKNPLETNN